MSCLIPFGKTARKRALQEENEWLKRMLSREQLQRQQAQAQAQQQQLSLHSYEVKCALLEAEVVHAAQAAHELGEQMCMFLARPQPQCLEHAAYTCTPTHHGYDALEAAAPGSSPWSLCTTSKRHGLTAPSPDDAVTPRIAAARDQDSSSSACRAFELTPGGSQSLEPNLRMQERMARLSVHLKGMAAQWRTRLETCGTQGPLQDSSQQEGFQQASEDDAHPTCQQRASGCSPSNDGGSSISGSSSSSGCDEEARSSLDVYELSRVGRALDEAALAGAVNITRVWSSNGSSSGDGSRSSSRIGVAAGVAAGAVACMAEAAQA